MGVVPLSTVMNLYGQPAVDWEHKRFLVRGDLGELTGEMGTVATFDRTERFFAATLARYGNRLLRRRILLRIPSNLRHDCETSSGIWPLEFTCRFGYPGFAVLDPRRITSWAPTLPNDDQGGRPKNFRSRPGVFRSESF